MGRFNKLLLYCSLIFLIVYLYQIEHLSPVTIYSNWSLIGAFALLFLGFTFQCLCWHGSLTLHSIPATKKQAVVSIGLSVFAKYIPGKIWLILGRASCISEITGHRVQQVTIISLYAQLISIWTGLLIGLPIVIDYHTMLFWPYLIACLVLSLIVLENKIRSRLLSTIELFIKSTTILSFFKTKTSYPLILMFLATWGCWSIGFLLLLIACIDSQIAWSNALFFPLAATLGIVAFITPGGLGVREGILFALMLHYGFDAKFSTTFVILSRIWFVIGELFIFSVGAFFHFQNKKG